MNNEDEPKYPPKFKPNLYSLDPKLYYVDRHGSVRKISEKGLELAEKLGI